MSYDLIQTIVTEPGEHWTTQVRVPAINITEGMLCVYIDILGAKLPLQVSWDSRAFQILCYFLREHKRCSKWIKPPLSMPYVSPLYTLLGH